MMYQLKAIWIGVCLEKAVDDAATRSGGAGGEFISTDERRLDIEPLSNRNQIHWLYETVRKRYSIPGSCSHQSTLPKPL